MWGWLQWNVKTNGTSFEEEWLNLLLIYAVITNKSVKIYVCHKQKWVTLLEKPLAYQWHHLFLKKIRLHVLGQKLEEKNLQMPIL